MDLKSVELAKDVKLPYVEHGDASGTPMLFLHGYAGTWRDFEAVLDQLPQSVRALAVTQRGHGDASKPENGYRVRDFAADAAAFLDALQMQSTIVVGASSGGFTARRLAMDYPVRTRGLVLLGTPATLRGKPQVEEMWKSTISKLSDPVDPAFVRQFGSVAMESVSQELVTKMVQQALKMPARVWRETNRGLLEDESFHELDRVAAPTLIVWGDQDAISPRSDQEALLERIPHARLVVYHGAGHSFYHDAPGRVAADLTAFVQSVGG